MSLPAPKHYWNFNETGGTVAADTTGSARIVLDRPDWVPGRMGNAVRFNPHDGVRLATTNLPELPAPWTAAFWVMREADSEAATLFSSVTHALKLEQWRNTHDVGLTAFGKFDASFGCAPPLGEWAHLALVGTASETRLYLDGKLHGTVSMSINLGLHWLGSTQGFEEIASAILDEIKVFDEALSDAQVAELAAEGSSPTDVPLAGVWTYGLGGGDGHRIPISVAGDRVTIDMSSYGRPTASGSVVSRSEIQATFPDDATFKGTLASGPDRILWSNNTVWSRLS